MKRIPGKHSGYLGNCSNHDAGRLPRIGRERRPEDPFHLRFRLFRLKDDVAAGYISPDRLKPGCFTHRFELSHGQLASAANVDGTEKSD